MKTLSTVVLAAALASVASAGPEWTEMGDAGSGLPDAESPTNMGGGPLAGIKGKLDGAPGPRGMGDFEDVYRIRITDFTMFSATISPNTSGSPTFDSQLWLFDEMGNGLLANDDNPAFGMNGEAGLGRVSNDGSGAELLQNGIYFLAISGAGNIPLNADGDPIFNFATNTEVSGPDGTLGSLMLDSWSGPGAIGEYTIQISGASFFDIPAPSAAGLFALAGLTASRRRRAS